MKHLILHITLLIFATQLVAQSETQTNYSFSLEEAVEFATKNAYEIINSNYETEKARKKIWETTAIGLPQVSAEANYTDNLDIMTNMLPAEIFKGKKGTFIPIKFGQQYNANGSITATQLLFDGVYLTGLKASKVFYQLSQDRHEKVEQSIKEATMKAYFFVLATEENFKTLKDNLKSNEQLKIDTDAYYKEGLIEDTDTHQMNLAVSNAQSRVNDALGNIKTARTTLKYLMGIDLSKKIILKSNLSELVDEVLLNKQKTLLDWEAHIDYRILDTQHKAQELLLKKEKASYLPRLSAFYRIGENTQSNEWDVFGKNEWFKSSSVGLRLSIPIFSSGMRNAKVQQAKLDLKKVNNQIIQKKQELEQNRILTTNTLNTARTNYQLAKTSRDIAKKIFEKTQMKYKEGVSNSMELTQKEQQFINTHSRYIQTMIGLLQANIDYKKAMGTI